MWMIFTVALLFSYLFWRLKRYSNAKGRFASQFPNQRCLYWKASSGAGKNKVAVISRQLQLESLASDGSVSFDSPAGADLKRQPDWSELRSLPGWAATLDGGIAGASVAEAFHHIDPAVLNAIEFSTADHIHNLASVDAYVHDHFFESPEASAEGWLHRLEGYVAEQKAAAALEHAGHYVEFAHLPNQPGWDLVVDGRPLQVKEGVDIAHVKDFLVQHPDINVITGDDIAHQVRDAHVTGIAGLNHHSIATSTKDTLHGIQDGFHPTIHVPVVTLLLSTYREGLLLWNDRTTIEKALKHIAVDVGSVAASAFLGAKAGALIGSIAGPIGAAFVGFLGAVGGAISGKVAANAMRYKTFNQVRAEYCQTVDFAQVAVQTRIERSQADIRQLQTHYQARYEKDKNAIIATAERLLAGVRNSGLLQIASVAKLFPMRLDELTAQLCAAESEVLASIPGSALGLIFPTGRDLLRSVIMSWFRRARRLVKAEKKQFLAIKQRTPETMLRSVRRFCESYDWELQRLQNDLQTLATQFIEARESAGRIRNEAIDQVERVRSALIKELGGEVGALYAELSEFIGGWNALIAQSREALRREARPVGIDL
jgi:F0F1-type ATP synthase membrane subunit b/b'